MAESCKYKKRHHTHRQFCDVLLGSWIAPSVQEERNHIVFWSQYTSFLNLSFTIFYHIYLHRLKILICTLSEPLLIASLLFTLCRHNGERSEVFAVNFFLLVRVTGEAVHKIFLLAHCGMLALHLKVVSPIFCVFVRCWEFDKFDQPPLGYVWHMFYGLFCSLNTMWTLNK